MGRKINQDLERVFNTYYNILYKAARGKWEAGA